MQFVYQCRKRNCTKFGQAETLLAAVCFFVVLIGTCLSLVWFCLMGTVSYLYISLRFQFTWHLLLLPSFCAFWPITTCLPVVSPNPGMGTESLPTCMVEYNNCIINVSCVSWFYLSLCSLCGNIDSFRIVPRGNIDSPAVSGVQTPAIKPSTTQTSTTAMLPHSVTPMHELNPNQLGIMCLSIHTCLLWQMPFILTCHVVSKFLWLF